MDNLAGRQPEWGLLRDVGIHLQFSFRLQFWETLERLSSFIMKRSIVIFFACALGWASMRASAGDWTSAVGHTSAPHVKERLNSRPMGKA